MRQVHPATRLGAGVLGQLGEECDGLIFVSRFDDVGDGDADHRYLPPRFPGDPGYDSRKPSSLKTSELRQPEVAETVKLAIETQPETAVASRMPP